MAELSSEDLALLNEIQREPLRGSEQFLVDPEKTLWRQVHPNHLDTDVVGPGAFETVSSQAFSGTPSARLEISTCMHPEVTAEAAFEHYVKTNASAGSFKVQVKNVHQAKAVAVDDSDMQVGEDPVLGHAFIDLRGMPKLLQRRARSLLADVATKNRRVYPCMENTEQG